MASLVKAEWLNINKVRLGIAFRIKMELSQEIGAVLGQDVLIGLF